MWRSKRKTNYFSTLKWKPLYYIFMDVASNRGTKANQSTYILIQVTVREK